MITKEQQRAIKCKHEQDDQGMTYLQFRRSVKYGYDCLMVQWCTHAHLLSQPEPSG